jgi:tyrosinase
MRMRQSLQDLQFAYERGDKTPLETVMRAWKGIKELPPEDPNSYFVIAGYHGEPFRGGGWGSSNYWGGYCNHGNVLFPTWHRAYLLRLENALRTIEGCAEVTLPFWDECSPSSTNNGIPWALTVENFTLDGQSIPNPLKSFKLNRPIKDHIGGDNPDYSKPLGYETVRYPLSGLLGKHDKDNTKAHNDKFPSYPRNVALLNANIVDWLTSYVEIDDGGTINRIDTNVAKAYANCLKAPNYTLFSNTTSAAEWNSYLPEGAEQVVPLESPHNSIHLAVGGYDVPTGPNADDDSAIAGANGDMGENDTAAFDPIFFFHHCFVDRMFWLWQQRHGATEKLDLIAQYPGTNTVDGQNPTPGFQPNAWLTLDSPLSPFQKPDSSPFTSNDVVNIEAQLGYKYGPGSFEDQSKPLAAAALTHKPSRRVHVTGVDRGVIRGSFLISAFARVDGRMQHIGSEAVLSRWHVEGCANCQTHLKASAVIPIPEAVKGVDDLSNIHVEVRTRDGSPPSAAAALTASATPARPSFRVEIR